MMLPLGVLEKAADAEDEAVMAIARAPGASGSSTTSASERVPSGAPEQESGGERSSPSQLCRRWIGPP
jgi:hypothetical protein